jgi:hypothetical protein
MSRDVPMHARDGSVISKIGKKKRIASAKAVVKYVVNKKGGNNLKLFKKEDSHRRCMSYYSICE